MRRNGAVVLSRGDPQNSPERGGHGNPQPNNTSPMGSATRHPHLPLISPQKNMDGRGKGQGARTTVAAGAPSSRPALSGPFPLQAWMTSSTASS